MVAVPLFAAAGYAFMLWLGHWAFYTPLKVWLMWPPEAFVIGLLGLLSRRRWPVALMACVVVKLVFEFVVQKFPLSVGLAVFASDGAEVALTVLFLKWIKMPFDKCFDSFASCVKFQLFVVILPKLIPSGLPALALISAYGGGFWKTYIAWVLSNMVGAAVVTTLLLNLGSMRRGGFPRLSHVAEGVICMAATAVVAYIIFSWSPDDPLHWISRPFYLYPLLAWCAYRLGVAMSALQCALLSVIVTYFASHGLGPYAHRDPLLLEVWNVQMYILITTAVFTMLAAVIRESRERQKRLGEILETQKRVEAELMQHRQHLEEKVIARTAELRTALVEAQASNRAKGAFLAMMGHEIRTPLNGVLGMTELLSSTPLSAEQGDWLSTLRRSGADLLGIINDILDFSKIEAGKMTLEKAPFRLAPLLDRVVQPLMLQAKEKGIALRCEMAPRVPTAVSGDASRLRQILFNLLGNALKFTERGEVVLSVQLNAGAGDRILFEIRDTGIGIPPEMASEIFQPFQQADTSVHRRFGGTGLGLVISKRLVEMMGGEISAESEPGKGSVFRVVLDLPAVEMEPSVVPPQAVSVSSRRILLVDDLPINQKVVTTLLQRRGHRVELAKDGMESLERMAETAYDLVLMDVQMPGMDGLLATRRRREREQVGYLPRQRIIGFTAGAIGEDRADCLAAGMDGFLAKPFRPEELFAVIEEG